MDMNGSPHEGDPKLRGAPAAYARAASKEDGAVAVIVALAMVALLAIVAMSVDLGQLFVHDRELQTAADAGAQAGALELIYTGGGQAAAAGQAQAYVDTNVAASRVVAGNMAAWAPAVDARSVTVDLVEQSVPFLIAPVVGLMEGRVTAHARAEVKYVTGTDKLFPVAINYMNPHRFRFLIKNGAGAEVHRFEVGDSDGDGTFDSVTSGGSFTPGAAGVYTVDLQAVDTDGEVGVELPGIGLWRVANPSNPSEKLYRVGMSHDVGGATVTVRIQAAASVTDARLNARLGTTGFDLVAQGGGVYQGTVVAPTKTGNDGWQTHDLKIQKLTGNDSVGRYVAVHPDVPLRHLMFQPSFYDGYSGIVGQTSSLGAKVVVRILTFGDTYVMKLGNQAGSGLYSGNWRIADIYPGENTRSEIGTVPIPDTWVPIHPLVIGGPLEPEPGASVGQIKGGLDDRLGGSSPAFTTGELQTLSLGEILARMPPDDPYFVIIPIVEFASIQGASKPYKIAGFCGFYITSYTKAGDVDGVFIRWAAPGSWSDSKPPGNLYIETAVITE